MISEYGFDACPLASSALRAIINGASATLASLICWAAID
jgi:hypothetical protein